MRLTYCALFLFYLADFLDCKEIFGTWRFFEGIPLFRWISFCISILDQYGVNSGLLPTKGLTLPLISYGGSSLIVSFMILGVLLRALKPRIMSLDKKIKPL